MAAKTKWRDLPEPERRKREAAAHSSLFGDESRAKPTAGPSADPADIFDTGVELFANLVKALRKAEEGADKPRVPSTIREPDYDYEPGCDCPRSELEIGGRGHLIDCDRKSYRECEGCGQYRHVDEMAVCFLPGTGESYQCIACRGGP